MTFSVDYRLVGGATGNQTFLWVIEPKVGQPLVQRVALQTSGTLQLVAPALKPDSGPFRCHLEVVGPGNQRQRISEPHGFR